MKHRIQDWFVYDVWCRLPRCWMYSESGPGYSYDIIYIRLPSRNYIVWKFDNLK